MDLHKELTKFLKTSKKPLIVILGPTASGKTELSLKVAKDFDGEIISVDSRQIYKGLEIGSDVLPENKRKKIPHYLLEITTPDKPISMAEFARMAREKITDIHERGKVPMLVGGTGLYISALTEAYDLPPVPPDEKLRTRLTKKAAEKGKEAVHKELQKLDPQAAEQIHPNNLRYVIRAIEICKACKGKRPRKKSKPPYEIYFIGIQRPREELYERIEKRVYIQIKKGLLEEVKALLKKGYDPYLPAMASLGVKEIIPHLQDDVPLEECLDTLKKNTRNFAKRQMTWFRKYDNVNWLKPSEVEKCLKKATKKTSKR